MNKIANLLTRGDVIAAEPLASGFPVWLPFGTVLAERFDELVRQAVHDHVGSVDTVETPLLYECGAYDEHISESLAYANMYELPAGARSAYLRPDNVVALAEHLGRGDSRTLLTQGSLWRAETQRAVPLIRDRHMWRPIEVVSWVPADEAGAVAAAAQALWGALGQICHALALPQIYYDAAGLRDHSDRCLMSLTVTGADQLELTSTLFELSTAFGERLGVPGRMIDLGLTAKLLALSLSAHQDRLGLVLPTSVAPQLVIIGTRRPEDLVVAHRLSRRLGVDPDRILVDDRPWKTVLGEGRRRGIPLVILADPAHPKLIDRLSGASVDLQDDPPAQLAAALQTHDQVLRDRQHDLLVSAVEAGRVVRLRPAGDPTPAGWHELGPCRGIGFRPDLDHQDGVTVLSREKRLY